MASALTWQERVVGFGTCVMLGITLSSLALFVLEEEDDGAKFATLHTLGTVVSVASTTFLMPPSRQLRHMLHETRAVAATSVYFLGATGSLALGSWKGAGLRVWIVVLLSVQLAASLWYALTYFPLLRLFVRHLILLRECP